MRRAGCNFQPMTTYHVSKWGTTYENNRSRKVKDLAWVPIPNKHDGERYSRLMQRKDAATIFAAWILILQVASKCQPRGSLMRSDGSPHNAESLSLKTRVPPLWFELALPVLVEMKWLVLETIEQGELPLDGHHDGSTVPPRCQSGDEEGKGREGKGIEQKGGASALVPFVPPTPAEVEAYSREIEYPLPGQAWCDAYQQKGWMVGKNKMKDWRAAVRNWKASKYVLGHQNGHQPAPEPPRRYANLPGVEAKS